MSNVFGPPPAGGSAPMTLTPDGGMALGSNVDAAPHEIAPGHGRYLQDVLLDIPGVYRQRGPITPRTSDFPGLPSNARIIGMTSLADPTGADSFRLLLLVANKNTFAVQAYIYGRGTVPATQAFHSRAFFEMDKWESDGTYRGDPFAYFDDRRSAVSLLGVLKGTLSLSGLSILNSDPDPFFASSLALDGGALFGLGLSYGADTSRSSHRALYHWRGAAKSTIGLTFSLTQNSPVVTAASGSFITGAQAEPGMFLTNQANNRCLGVVKSVDSDTQITLESNVLNPTAAVACFLTSLRRPYSVPSNNISPGTIITSTASAVVNGGGTKFLDQGVSNGDLLFRANDFAFVGTISSVASNQQLTLGANATVALGGDAYVIQHAAPWAAGAEPVFPTFYNGMQLLANADNNRSGFNERNRIFVTDAKNLEGIDLTKSGSFFDLPSTKPHTDIRGLFATESAALVFLAEATYGLFGNTPTTLVPRVISNDGLLSPMTLQAWQGGAIWAGYRSLYWFDGTTVHDLLVGKAQAAHQKALSGLDYGKLRAWSMLHNHHYVCFLSSINTGVFDYTQGHQNITDPQSVMYDPTALVYAINLDTGALTFWSNVHVRGYAAPPGKLVSTRDAYFVVESTATGGPIICSADALFAETGTSGFVGDPFLAAPKTVDFAPHFFMEGRLSTFGDPERAKRLQMILLQYSLYGPSDTTKLGIDVVTGMGQDTKRIALKARTATDPTSPTSWVNKRSRFSTSAGMAGVRFYTLADGAPSAARIGPWSIGFKLKRPGRT